MIAPLMAILLQAGGEAPAIMEDPQELRKLAEWYRAFAEVAGSTAARLDRLKFAEYLERRAADLERQAADDP
jgi:hypothetical protein